MSKDKVTKMKCGAGNVAGCGGAYFLAFIGSLVYYWQLAEGFGAFITGFLKAVVWPAFLAHHLFGL
jgi:hypothetical protein